MLPFVKKWMYLDGIMINYLCIIDTNNRLVVVRIAERGVGWWRVDEIGEEGTDSQLLNK